MGRLRRSNRGLTRKWFGLQHNQMWSVCKAVQMGNGQRKPTTGKICPSKDKVAHESSIIGIAFETSLVTLVDGVGTFSCL